MVMKKSSAQIINEEIMRNKNRLLNKYFGNKYIGLENKEDTVNIEDEIEFEYGDFGDQESIYI